MFILKATCHNPGHDWKDGHKRGEIAFAYWFTLKPPYSAGQHPRVGNIGWTVSTDFFTFSRASFVETIRLMPIIAKDAREAFNMYRLRRAFRQKP